MCAACIRASAFESLFHNQTRITWAKWLDFLIFSVFFVQTFFCVHWNENKLWGIRTKTWSRFILAVVESIGVKFVHFGLLSENYSSHWNTIRFLFMRKTGTCRTTPIFSSEKQQNLTVRCSLMQDFFLCMACRAFGCELPHITQSIHKYPDIFPINIRINIRYQKAYRAPIHKCNIERFDNRIHTQT